MSDSGTIHMGADGFYHPASEEEIVQLVLRAREQGLQVRCRGAAHSVAWSIYSDPGKGDPQIPNKVSVEEPPEGPNINLMLDKLDGLEWIDEQKGIVEVEAGIHLGPDPYDPTHTATREKSLLFQVFLKGWGVNDLGGITHQTVSGFLGTGSAGGSLQHDLAPNIVAFRVIDGRGQAAWVEKNDGKGDEKGNDLFDAVAVSMGLLGIITKVRLQLNRTFNIEGQQATTPATGPECPIDLFGPGDASRPSLRRFLENTPYSRILWWPQKKARIVVWEAKRVPGTGWPDPSLKPYEEFSRNVLGQLQQVGGAIFYTLLGNRGFFRTWGKLWEDFPRFTTNVRRLLRRRLGGFLAGVVALLLTLLVLVVAFPLVLFFSIFKSLLRRLFAPILGLFQPLTGKKGPIRFHDYYWRSLPMDNTAGDVLLGTEFTELWVPLAHTERTMNLLREHYERGGFAATGFYATEIYGGFKSSHWMHAGYDSGEYAEGTVRIDLFWYTNNEGIPNAEDGFFRQYWELLRDNGVPFRLHWGKYIPDFDHEEWAEYYRSQLPKWDGFLQLREQRDPENIFLTSYWKKRLHITP